MIKSHHVIYALTVIVGGGWGAHFIERETNDHPGFECGSERVATYGWTQDSRAMAEMAAILRWKETTVSTGQDASFAEWHNAQNRYLQCRTIGGPGGAIQCRIAALPCRAARKGDGV